MNKFQKKVSKAYGGGDYSYMATLPKGDAPSHYNDCGDTLFTFLMRELADEGTRMPMTKTTAAQRVQSAIRDLEAVLRVLEGKKV